MGQFQNLQLGSTSTISCSVPQLMNSVINWLSHSGAVVSSRCCYQGRSNLGMEEYSDSVLVRISDRRQWKNVNRSAI